MEEIKEDIGKKDLEYYLRNDRKYTQAEKEEYKRLKAEKEKEILENDEWQRGDWAYEWNADGSLKSVKLPDGENVIFEYDALGRRIKKIANGKIKRYLWDGNVLLHEWEYDKEEEPRKIINELGEISFDRKEPIENLITWVYENNSFVPIAKIVGNEIFSIINDYIGRPVLAFDNKGEKVWSCDYDIYGNVRNLKGEKSFIPFRQLGQYEDIETGLYYNRFRYYSPESGVYISKDPISILGGLNVYAYVKDTNSWVDVFGLTDDKLKRIFENADYHGLTDNAIKSKAPINGQYALNNSIQVKETSFRRIGIDDINNEIVILDRTMVRADGVEIFHGHVREWNDLHIEQQNALKNAKLVNKKGKICKK